MGLGEAGGQPSPGWLRVGIPCGDGGSGLPKAWRGGVGVDEGGVVVGEWSTML